MSVYEHFTPAAFNFFNNVRPNCYIIHKTHIPSYLGLESTTTTEKLIPCCLAVMNIFSTT